MTDSPSSQDIQARADQLLSQALERSGARDPRDYYRTQLKELRVERPEAYEDAVTYYRETLLRRIAQEEAEPLAAWTEYGCHLASLRAEGRTVAIDPTGRAREFESPEDREDLVLHLPRDRKRRALLVSLPVELSLPQRATYDWLVGGRLKLREPT